MEEEYMRDESTEEVAMEDDSFEEPANIINDAVSSEPLLEKKSSLSLVEKAESEKKSLELQMKDCQKELKALEDEIAKIDMVEKIFAQKEKEEQNLIKSFLETQTSIHDDRE